MENTLLKNAPRVIRTERLELRPMTDADAPRMLEILHSKQVSRTYMIPDFPSEAEARRLFERFKALSASPERFVYGLYRGERLVGFVNDVGIGAEAIELGYVVHPDSQGQGYATEMLRAAIRTLLGLGFAAVRAGFFEENAASRRVMEKSGMLPTGESDFIAYRGETHRCIYYEARAVRP